MNTTNVKALLLRAEIDAEKISAVVRLVVFLSLALVVLTAVGVRGAAMATALYGLGTAVGLFLASRRIFHPVIPYLFVTFDIILVVAQLLMLARSLGMRPASVFELPATALIPRTIGRLRRSPASGSPPNFPVGAYG